MANLPRWLEADLSSEVLEHWSAMDRDFRFKAKFVADKCDALILGDRR